MTITKDLADLCVEEGQQTRASVEITWGDEVSYQWFQIDSNSTKATALEDQTSMALLFERTELTDDGSYYVEIFCNALRGRSRSNTLRCRSRTMRLRVMQSVLAKVQDIVHKKGEETLADDTPTAVIIDSAGQRMYYMLLHILLTEALTIYIAAVSLEYDLDTALQCEEDLPYGMTHRDNLRFWLNTIYGRAPTAPILVVCTKTDLVRCDEIRKKRIQAVHDCVRSSAAFKCGAKIILDLNDQHLAVSSKEDEGFEAVRSVLERERTSLKNYGSTVSVGRFEFFSIIRELFAKKGEHRITWSEAKSIAHTCGITSDAEIQRLLQDMTDIGLLLWHDTTYARNLVILDLEWMITQSTELLCRRRIQERLMGENCAHTGRLIKLRDEGRLDAAVIPQLFSALRNDEERAAVLDYLVTFGLLAKLPSSSAEFSGT